MYLLDVLFPPREDELVLRGVDHDAFLARLEPALLSETDPRAIALLPFSDMLVRAAVHEAKYHGSGHAHDLLSSALREYLSDEEWLGSTCIVPVPLSVMRRRDRGFNQVLEVARRAKLGIPIESGLLTRVRDTVSQVALSGEERRRNMRGAFRAAQPVFPFRTYIVLDDVITTGATMQAAIDALTKAGAEHVIPLAFAH
ncbi:MAG TPA: phosphoribosyltransferase family protein [Candidatus Paceibacterota bacterium]|nr:phosphoribosyltransferase family protein [Candidatus Paceibacterota bacterium]